VEWDGNPFVRFLLFPRVARVMGPAESHSMGLGGEERGVLLCVDDRGERWTLVGDPEYVRTLNAAPEWVSSGLVIPWHKFPDRRRGWPEDWTRITY
jgi:hypothetical protein